MSLKNNIKLKLKSYNFWVSLASASLLFLRLLGGQLGFVIDANAFMDIFTALCGVLVVVGLITLPNTTQIDGATNYVQNAQNVLQTVQNDTQISQKLEKLQQNLKNGEGVAMEKYIQIDMSEVEPKDEALQLEIESEQVVLPEREDALADTEMKDVESKHIENDCFDEKTVEANELDANPVEIAQDCLTETTDRPEYK